jgi:hypothetical protein
MTDRKTAGVAFWTKCGTRRGPRGVSAERGRLIGSHSARFVFPPPRHHG